jgi:lipoprotein-anchoring transpeptidase ErfK/SrfK
LSITKSRIKILLRAIARSFSQKADATRCIKDPRNPLGDYWIGFWNNGSLWIGFHGTLNPSFIGKAASHGCLYMRRSDLKELFSQVQLGTPVRVVR